jgi:hypothetical protein
MCATIVCIVVLFDAFLRAIKFPSASTGPSASDSFRRHDGTDLIFITGRTKGFGELLEKFF